MGEAETENERLRSLVVKLQTELEDRRNAAERHKVVLEKAKGKIRQLLEKLRRRDDTIAELRGLRSPAGNLKEEVGAQLELLQESLRELEEDIELKERLLLREHTPELDEELQCKKEFLEKQKLSYAELLRKAKGSVLAEQGDRLDRKSSGGSDDLYDLDWNAL